MLSIGTIAPQDKMILRRYILGTLCRQVAISMHCPGEGNMLCLLTLLCALYVLPKLTQVHLALCEKMLISEGTTGRSTS